MGSGRSCASVEVCPAYTTCVLRPAPLRRLAFSSPAVVGDAFRRQRYACTSEAISCIARHAPRTWLGRTLCSDKPSSEGWGRRSWGRR